MTVQKVCLWDHHVDEVVITLAHCKDPRNIHYIYVCSTDEIRQDMEDVIARMRPWYIKNEFRFVIVDV